MSKLKFKNKRLLVTGGAGFIGSHLSKRLLELGYEVIILDSLIYGKREWISPGSEFIQGDIRDLNICKRATEGVDCIFHLAAMSRSGPSFSNIADCTEVNITGTQNLLLAARDNHVCKIIYSGSSTYYGNGSAPQNENESKPDFLNAYGLTKFVGEEYVKLFDRIYNLPSVTLRYFNVYGPRQPTEGVYALVMGIFLKRKKMGLPLEIHGSGLQRRDFVHVSDVVEANVAAYLSKVRNKIYNVGSGKNYSILELANMISDKQIFLERRSGDADITLASIDLIKKDLGWTPKVFLDQGFFELENIA